MQESKVITLIRDLSPKHKKSFRLFVQSPFFNKHEKTTEAIELILDTIEKGVLKLDRVKLFDSLFPFQTFDEQRLFNLMSYIKKLLNRFLAYQYLSEQEAEEEILALEAAYYFNQFDLLQNRGQQFAKFLDNKERNGLKTSYYHFRLNYLLSFYDFESTDRSKPIVHQKMLDNLDRHYLVEKLRICCHLYGYQTERQISYHYGFLEELLYYFERNIDKYKIEPTIELYYTILQTLKNKNGNTAFEKLKALLLGNTFDNLDEEVQQDVLSAACNYCITKINSGDNSFRLELFHLYQKGLESTIFLEKGNLSEWRYKNIATLGCDLGEFDWTEEFINSYKDKLPADCRHNAYSYNLGNLFFHKKRFDDAISQLQLVEFSDIKYYLSVNLLLLRIYYLKKDVKAAFHLMDAFRLYILRSKELTTVQKKAHNSFLRYLKKLMDLKYGKPRTDMVEQIEKLNEKIRSNKNVLLKKWLLEEILVAA